ncbi:ABC transporter permease family protein, partial [Fusobacterium ulcerans]
FSTLEVEIASTLMGELNFSKAMIFGMIQFFILIILNLTGVFVKEYELEGEEEYKKQNIFFRGYSIIYLFLQYLIVASSFLFSFYNYYTGEFSIKAYMRIFSKSFNEDYEVIRGIMNSIGISAAVSFISIIVIYFIIKNYSRITDVIIFSNLGISGAFLAVALFYLNVLFNIPLLLLLGIGYILVSIPIGYSFMYQYIKKFPVNLLESSLLDCSNGFERFIYIEFPILKNIFLSAFLQIFAIVFGEFTIGYTMQLGDIVPVASLVNYSLVSNKKYLESAAFSSVILLIVFSLFILGEYLKDRD